MSTVIAIAGKGGTGKTTFAALLTGYLVRSGKTPVLAVDADPDSNLPEALGLSGDKSLSTIGRAREEFFQSRAEVPAGMPKEAYLELRLNQVLVETKDIDLLVMGRPEGSGCYCYINNVLRKYLDVLSANYPFVIIDNEAGLEHLSRRTTRDVDYLLIVSDYSLNGLRAAKRIKLMVDEISLTVRNIALIINNAPEVMSPQFTAEADAAGISCLGVIPRDDMVTGHDIEEKSLLSLDDASPAAAAVKSIGEKIFS